MICGNCGQAGIRWMGPFSRLIHTECPHCGGVNCQAPPPCETCDREGVIDERQGGSALSGWVDCPDCNGTGEV